MLTLIDAILEANAKDIAVCFRRDLDNHCHIIEMERTMWPSLERFRMLTAINEHDLVGLCVEDCEFMFADRIKEIEVKIMRETQSQWPIRIPRSPDRVGQR